MPFPTITTAPTAPTRSMSNDEFIAAADAFVAWMATLDDQINAWSAYAAVFGASLGVSGADDQLAAIAALSPTAGDVPYFTSSSAAALIASTTFGRALLAMADAAALRTAAGLGSIATQAASNVAITGGSVAGITDLAVADGGTGASTASAARTNLGLGTAATADSAQLVPTGAVLPFAMSTAPSGWLECDGAAVSRTTYAALFSAIGTTHGTGDGSTTFNVPDLRGEFVRGWDHGRGVDSGRSFGSAQSDDLKAHTHPASSNPGSGGGSMFQSTGGTPTTINTGSTGGTETRPRNKALMYCVKT